MTNKREQARAIVTDMLSPEIAAYMAGDVKSEEFGSEIGQLAFDHVFAGLWTRPGLNRRDRSLITVSVLIALRATEELNFHIPAAIKNGVTKKELEELIYHCTGYTGFPACASARQQAAKLLADTPDNS